MIAMPHGTLERRSPDLLRTLHSGRRADSRALFASLTADEHRGLVAYVAALTGTHDVDAARYLHHTFGPRPRFLARRDQDGAWCAMDSLTAQIVLTPFGTQHEAEALCLHLERHRED